MLFNLSDHYFSYYTTKQVTTYKQVIILLLLAGMILRLFHYFDNRSLWEDEIYLSAGIVNMTYHELIHGTLPHLQKAPLGYLLISHTFVVLFGKTEMSLRLFSLICGLISMPLFLLISQNFLKPIGVVVAMALFTLSPPVIYHTVEAKPYGTELLATLIIIWWFIRYQNSTSIRELLTVGISGAILVWFSYTALFVLLGIALCIAVIRIGSNKITEIWLWALPVAIWIISFGFNYFLFTREGSNSGWLVDFWARHDGYMPAAPLPALKWIIKAIISFLNYPLGITWFNDWRETSAINKTIQRMVILPAIALLLGIIYLYRHDKRLLLLTGCIPLIALAASVAKAYPIHERLTVYLLPLAILIIASGCQSALWLRLKPGVARYIFIVLLVFGPLWNTTAQIIHPYLFGDYKKSFQREALAYVNINYQPGDIVYVYWNDLPGYDLYKQMYNLKYTAIRGQDHRHQASDFDQYFNMLDAEFAQTGLKTKKRVWIIYNEHIDIPVGDYIGDPAWYYKQDDGITRFKQHLHQSGKQIQLFKLNKEAVPTDIGAVLYDFSGNK